MPNIIECSNLTKKYDDIIALRNLHFSVERDYRHAHRRRNAFQSLVRTQNAEI